MRKPAGMGNHYTGCGIGNARTAISATLIIRADRARRATSLKGNVFASPPTSNNDKRVSHLATTLHSRNELPCLADLGCRLLWGDVL